MTLTCSCAIPIRRAWAMPSADTFSIPPIADLLDRWLDGREVIVDPFGNSKRGTITNDLNPETSAQFHLDAKDFLAKLESDGVRADAFILDPPYSHDQVRISYQDVGRKFGLEDGWLAGRWTDAKDRARYIVRPGGISITCGWNSAGMGLKRGFELREVLIVCHGSGHNDTIVTVEEKLPHLFDQGDPC
jgi:hypothetical protein